MFILDLLSSIRGSDLRGVGEGRDPPRPKFIQFHTVFGKIRPKSFIRPRMEGWRPQLRENLDLPLIFFHLASAICHRPSLENGHVSGGERKLRPGDNVTFRCMRGYVVNGSAMSTCEEDRTWSPSIPRCDLDPGILLALLQLSPSV